MLWRYGRSKLGKTTSLSPSAMTTMNWLRGVAAVAVLLGHARGLFMQDFGQLENRSVLWKAFYFVSALGHEAVMVFFILSGFLVGSTVLAQIADGRWALGDYMSRRMTRLYVVLIPGLLLTAAWDAAGMRLFGTAGIYGGVINARYLTLPDVTVTQSWGHFFGNVGFLQHLFIQSYGSNGPLWSLPYEFWAYLLFPFLVLAGRSDLSTSKRLVYAVVTCGAIICGGWKLGLYLGIWLIGAALALWWRNVRVGATPTWAIICLWGLFALALLFGNATKAYGTYAEILLGLATAALLAGTLARPDAKVPTRAHRISERAAAGLAGFSYTLYVAHYPVLTFLFAATMDGNRWVASAKSVALVLGISAGLMLYAYLVAQLSEAHTDKLRVWLRKRLQPA